MTVWCLAKAKLVIFFKPCAEKGRLQTARIYLSRRLRCRWKNCQEVKK
ncbi:hypothetical protein THERMOS_771 [Bathymodiolus thermophilus thioautotrophic gill symbiont]|uniref:Uncharacterized protein n=1 Tax=Bathymodiolus thermophilus thioautotrophic gill symbiont TaxID=2360 RepID=A0A8H8XE62_9GAMM|nr:hypothetical protein THERMOS_771 [Bathymodiolus thermophilus thioautotrophic gill symbiont]